MSLKEKLSKISQDLQKTKAETEKEAQEKELEPVRLRIKELENQKNQLNLIKGSLELKSSTETGKGMREYSEETHKQVQKESTHLDDLINENKEALQKIGIENKDQFVKNSEFAEESEVVSYKKAKEEVANLETSDSALKEKLKTLGVSIDEESFSYDSAEKALSEKLQSLKDELLQEKIKTPEGKEEVANALSESLKDSVLELSFLKDEKNNTQSFYLNNGGEIIIEDKNTKFKNWYRVKLLTKKITDLEKTYGKSVVKEALLKAYGNEIEAAFENFDEKNNIKDKAIKADLERTSPEKISEASKAFDEFKKLGNVFLNTLKEKSKELEAKGVGFSSDRIQNYGGNYRDYAKLYEDDYYNDIVEKTMREPWAYPPVLNFDNLKKHIEKRIEQIKEFTEDIRKLETKKDVFMLTAIEGKIDRVHGRLRTGAVAGLERVKDSGLYKSENTKINDHLMQFKSREEALNYLNKKHAEQENTKQKALQVIETRIDFEAKTEELIKESEAQNFITNNEIEGSSISIQDIENKFHRIEENKKGAFDLMSYLIKKEAELSKEPVRALFENQKIEIISVNKQLEQLLKDIKNEENNLLNLNREITKHESNKPKIFGKDTWEKKLSDLKQEQKVLEEKIHKMSKEDAFALSNKSYFYIRDKECPKDIEKIIQKQKFAEGTLSEVLSDLKADLNEVINYKAPESIASLYEEYNNLEKKLIN